MDVLSIGESLPMKLPMVGVEALVVPEESSNPGFGSYIKLPDADHIDICKPKSKSDIRYVLARDLIVKAAVGAGQQKTKENHHRQYHHPHPDFMEEKAHFHRIE
jgi:hypothetical protein